MTIHTKRLGLTMKETIGERIKAAREAQGYTQDEFVQRLQLGWSRQILSSIEKGTRDIKALELSKISKTLHLELSYFLASPIESSQKPAAAPAVLWREKPTDSHKPQEAEFIQYCKNYRFLENLNCLKETVDIYTVPNKKISLHQFTYDEASTLAEEIRNAMNLGDYPGTSLLKILEDKYKIKFIFLNMGPNGSAASCIYDFGTCILINSIEVAWRQNFSIAHELFHIITWSESLLNEIKDNKLWDYNEKLANAFAASLLLPSEVLHREINKIVGKKNFTKASLVVLARQFDVSLESLLWRMKFLRFINEKTVKELLDDEQIRSWDKESFQSKNIIHYSVSERFFRLAYLAYSQSDISKSRLAEILGVSLAEVPDTLAKHGYNEYLLVD